MFIRNTLDEHLHPWLYHRAPDDGSGDGGDPGDGDDGDASGDDGDDEDAGSERTFSQADMDRIRRAETKKALNQGRKALLEELGISDPKEAKKLIEAAAKAADKDRSDIDRAREGRTAAEAKAAEAERKLAEVQLERDIDRALATAGVQPKRLARVAKLVALELGDEPDSDDIKAAIETIRDDLPEAFAQSGDGDGGRRAPSGEGKGGKPPAGQRGGNKEDPMARGAALAAQRQGRSPVNA